MRSDADHIIGLLGRLYTSHLYHESFLVHSYSPSTGRVVRNVYVYYNISELKKTVRAT